MLVPAALLAVVLTSVPHLPVESEMPKQKGVYLLKHNGWLDGSLTVAGAGAWVLSETVFKHSLAPQVCQWCDRAPDGVDTLNSLDAWGRGARWSLEGQRTADTLSTVSGLVLMPVAALGLDALLATRMGAVSEVPVDSLIIVESMVAASVITQTVKFVAGRERPFVHVLPPEQKSLTEKPDDNNVSFFSGHTEVAFALTVAAGTVAELRGYEGRWIIWAVGLPLSVLTGYLRMGADKHYLTDVLTGALAGSVVGFAVPVVFHGREGWKPTEPGGFEARLTAGPGGLAVVGRF
jgi:membrane-associated phospholipid phosphatase